MTRTLTFAILLLAALAAPAAARQDKTPTYKTPQDVFDAVLAATEKRDASTLLSCFTPAMQQRMAADHAAQGLLYRAQVEGKPTKEEQARARAKYAPLFEVMDRHGLSEKATKDLKVKGPRATPQEREAILKLVKDPAAFAAEFLTAYEKVNPRKVSKDDLKPKLADVKVEGDRASGQVVVAVTKKDRDKEVSREVKQPITFRKIDGSWRIEPESGKDK